LFYVNELAHPKSHDSRIFGDQRSDTRSRSVQNINGLFGPIAGYGKAQRQQTPSWWTWMTPDVSIPLHFTRPHLENSIGFLKKSSESPSIFLRDLL
jgi:hypothetical protein